MKTRKLRIVFYTDIDLRRDQWRDMFSRSDFARLVAAENVTIHFGQFNSFGKHNRLEDKVGVTEIE